jgi:hypothetical protein
MVNEIFATAVAMAVLSLGLLTMALLTMAPDTSAKRRCPPGQEDINNVCVPK